MKATTGRLAKENVNDKNIVHVASSSLLIIDITARTFVLLGKIVRTSGLQRICCDIYNITIPVTIVHNFKGVN